MNFTKFWGTHRYPGTQTMTSESEDMRWFDSRAPGDEHWMWQPHGPNQGGHQGAIHQGGKRRFQHECKTEKTCRKHVDQYNMESYGTVAVWKLKKVQALRGLQLGLFWTFEWKSLVVGPWQPRLWCWTWILFKRLKRSEETKIKGLCGPCSLFSIW